MNKTKCTPGKSGGSTHREVAKATLSLPDPVAWSILYWEDLLLGPISWSLLPRKSASGRAMERIKRLVGSHSHFSMVGNGYLLKNQFNTVLSCMKIWMTWSCSHPVSVSSGSGVVEMIEKLCFLWPICAQLYSSHLQLVCVCVFTSSTRHGSSPLYLWRRELGWVLGCQVSLCLCKHCVLWLVEASWIVLGCLKIVLSSQLLSSLFADRKQQETTGRSSHLFLHLLHLAKIRWLTKCDCFINKSSFLPPKQGPWITSSPCPLVNISLLLLHFHQGF